MKVKVIRAKLVDALKSVQNVVAGKGSLAVLQNVLIEANGNEMKLTTTDLELSIVSSCECEVVEPGATTLPVKLLFNSVIKLVEGVVEISVDENQLAKIVCGSANYRIQGISESEFPKLPKAEDSYSYNIQQNVLKEMFRKVAYAASQDDTRRALKGVLMSFKENKLTMVATDGRRLALIENEIEVSKTAESDIVLPSKVVQELQRLLEGEEEISIKIQKSQVCFKTSTVTIYSKLIDEVYPNYQQVIPSSIKEEVEIDRQLLLDALERVSVMTMDEAHSTKLIFTSGKLTVTSAVSQIGEATDEVPIKYVGEKLEIIFNPSYVMDPLKAIDDDEVKIKLNDGHSPAVIQCALPFIYVLMPLRIS